jgi:hypothetical protein
MRRRFFVLLRRKSMNTGRFGGILLALVASSTALAQSVDLTRAEVSALKAKVVAIQQAMGAEPAGYVKESEDFYLPTETQTAQHGKFWTVSPNLSLTYTDKAIKEGTANAEQAAKDIQARYAAALASGDPNAIVQMSQDAMRMSGMAAAAGMAEGKEDMTVYVQLNSNANTAIDPDGVVFESPGVIALRSMNGSDARVTVYVDPVALAHTETLSKFDLKTPEDGTTNKLALYNISISLDGALADIEGWAKSFDTKAMLSLIDQ